MGGITQTAGTLVLSGSNIYSGDTTLTSGILGVMLVMSRHLRF